MTVKDGTLVVTDSEFHAYAIIKRIFISAKPYLIFIYIQE